MPVQCRGSVFRCNRGNFEHGRSHSPLRRGCSQSPAVPCKSESYVELLFTDPQSCCSTSKKKETCLYILGSTTTEGLAVLGLRVLGHARACTGTHEAPPTSAFTEERSKLSLRSVALLPGGLFRRKTIGSVIPSKGV